jgi:cobalt-zinc-cadmium efflux system outer membrane protein
MRSVLHDWRFVSEVSRRLVTGLVLLLMLAGSVAAAGPTPLIPAQPSPPPAAPAPMKPAAPTGGIAAQSLPPLKLPQHFENDPKVVEDQLKQLVEQAITNNPDLLAAHYAAEAVGHRVLPAGMPDDPYLGYRMKDLPTTFSMTRENATEKQIELSQRYPFPGKLTLRQAAAGREADVVRADVRIALLRLITEVRLAFANIFVVDKDIQLVLEQQRMLRELRDIATSKYRLGPGLQQDVLNADVALAQLDTTLIDLTRKRETWLIRLEVLLNRPTVEVEPLGTLPPAGLRLPVEQLEEMVLASNPEIQRLGHAVDRDTLNERLAARAPLPDMLLYLAYGSRNDYPGKTSTVDGKTVTQGAAVRPDLMTGQIMFDIPVFYFSKQREQLYEAQATLRRTRARLAAARDTALGSLHDLLARLAEHEQTARSYEQEVIPLARSEVGAAISAYRVDKVDFLTLLAAQDNLEKYETAYWHNEADRYRDLAQIDEVTGAAMSEAGATR